MGGLPTGTVTFLFTDVEGSTRLLARLGEGYAAELEAHRVIVREAAARANGAIVDQYGDEAFLAFSRAQDAVDAAREIQQRHAGRVMRIRIGLHTGEPTVHGEGYLGLDVHRAARIGAAGHGGQVLLSGATRALLPGLAVDDLGEYELRGLSSPERIYALHVAGAGRAGPLRVRRAARGLGRLIRSRTPAPERMDIRKLESAVRATLPGTPERERDAVRALAGSLATASRAEEAASAYLARADRRVLERRLASYREMSVTSRFAQRELDKTEHQLALLDTLVADRDALLATCRHDPPDPTEIASAATRLEQALAETRTGIGDGAERLRRTRTRGVHHSPSGEYVVLAYDTVGIEYRHHHAAREAARAHARALRLTTKDIENPQKIVGQTEYFTGGFGGGP